MSANTFFSANLLLAYTAYFVGTASPGPSNLAIMSIAANNGRKAALAFAAGVISGSMFWASIATVGISAALIAYSHFIVAIKIFGGVYLLWLAFKSGRTALSATAGGALERDRPATLKALYVKGALLHLTNPKAILVWVSIVALSSNSSGATHGAVIPGCAVIGTFVFSGYAVLFSIDRARRIYKRTRRALEGCLAVVFGVAGVRLLGWSST
ncbi:LysE family translocator [Trinickia diaoshuihuensis]|uniref:LysE family translocator n=1 Tax=Trinickia diaoshuihuensis TaxID=2292265 RepID=UPI000E220B57|nr:LysE family translocator [Trinickia diaoshuihuensis]